MYKRQILEQSLAYEKKQAGNSIERLIQLYIQDLKNFKLETADRDLKKLETSADVSDYFLEQKHNTCLLYTSDAADERSSVDLGGRRIIKKKKKTKTETYVMHKKKQANH